MGKIELLGYKISRLELLNELEESGEVRLSDHMEFSVRFEPGEDMAVAVLEQYLGMEDSSKFHLKLVLEGIFHVDGIRNGKFPKEEQLKCYDSLFPYADQIIRMLSIESGLMEVAVEKKDLEPVSVGNGENPKTVGDKKVAGFQPDTDS